jgi:hypothetical protein
MIAHRRRDVAELNVVARALMDAEGRLGRERIEISGREFRAGDRIVCLRNSDALGVRNGTRGTIDQVDRARGRLHLRTDRGDEVCLDRRYLEVGDVRHAYALTRHASQGLTVERAFVLGTDAGRLQEWGYVALSRAREQTRLYVRGDELEPDTHARELGRGDPLSRFAQPLESSGSERLALEQRPLATGPKAGTRLVLERSKRDRLSEQQRLATEKIRARAKEQLAEAERRLERLPFYARGSRREELRREVARERAALRLADEKLAELERRSREAKQRPPLARASRETAVERERAPRLERTREPEQLELGIDSERSELEAERALQAHLDLHDPPQLPQSLQVLFAPERGGHARQVGRGGDVRAQALADVLPRRPPAEVVVAPAGACRPGDDLQLALGGPEREHRLPPQCLRVEDEALPIGALGLQLLQRPAQPLQIVRPQARAYVHAVRELVRSPDHTGEAADQHVGDVVAIERGQEGARVEGIARLRHPQLPSRSRCSRRRSTRRSGESIWISATRSAGSGSYDASSSGISNPHARTNSTSVSMLGATSPCSQRAITVRSLPLTAASSCWLNPARRRASRISTALLTVSGRIGVSLASAP